jgi:hypothetical protein
MNRGEFDCSDQMKRADCGREKRRFGDQLHAKLNEGAETAHSAMSNLEVIITVCN